MNRFLFSIMILLAFITLSCDKDEEIVQVENNVAPPDETIEEVVISNYVQKLYISLLGRKPTEQEKAAGFESLKAANLSVESRETIINNIFANSSYFDNEFNVLRSEYLNDLDSSDFATDLAILEFAKTLTSNPVEIAFWDDEIARMNVLIGMENNLKTGVYNMIEAHAVLVDNFEYDQINMGSENFVVSLFQNFMLRYPTGEELTQGKNMVDGKSAILFTQSGKHKDEIIAIFFAHSEYFEGQVRSNYLRFLYREPNNDEIALLAVKYQQNKDYKGMQRYILSLDEYVGIK